MSAYPRSNVAAYQSAAVHGGVAASDPHRLILMLLDGALERVHTARGCMERGETAEKARLIDRSISIIAELQGSLNPSGGGEIATNLYELYDYMTRRLLKATSENNVAILDEVSKLLGEIRMAWAEISPSGR